MNENELKNNTNENNVVTPVESAVSEKTDTISTPEATQINEPEIVPSEPEVTTTASDVTPVADTAVVQEPVVSETTPAEAASVEEPSTQPQVNVPAGDVNASTQQQLEYYY